jgi:leader peptidase (prepilin peptidase) / N-methyltransferase
LYAIVLLTVLWLIQPNLPATWAVTAFMLQALGLLNVAFLACCIAATHQQQQRQSVEFRLSEATNIVPKNIPSNREVGDDVLALDTQRLRRRGQWIAVGVLVGAFVGYMIVVPSLDLLFQRQSSETIVSRDMTELSLAERIRLASVSGFFVALFFAFGASVGSFLNVVIYRLPRAKPLLWPPSSCGSCGTRIEGRDNIPIFGWIMLGGHCRTCHSPVSMRYPMIEAAVASVFVLFFYAELLSGGWNLPVRMQNHYRGIVWILLYTKWDLVSIYLFHMFVLTALLAWGMIQWDLFRIPRRAATGSILLVVLLSTLFIDLNPAHLMLLRETPHYLLGLLTSAAGVITGCAVGWLCDSLASGVRKREIASASRGDTATEQIPSQAATSVEKQNADVTQSAQVAFVDSANPNLAPEPLVPDHEPTTDGVIGSESLTRDAKVQGDRYGEPSRLPAQIATVIPSCALVGSAFGPQAVIIIGFFAAFVGLAVRLWMSRRLSPLPPLSLFVFAFAVLHLAIWKWSYEALPSWMVSTSSNAFEFYGFLATTVAICCALASLVGLLRRKRTGIPLSNDVHIEENNQVHSTLGDPRG